MSETSAPAPPLLDGKFLLKAIRAAEDGIIIVNREGAIAWVNPAFERQTGYSASEILGQSPRVILSGRRPAAVWETLRKTVRSGKSWRGDFVSRRKDGAEFAGEVTVTPIVDDAGAISCYLGVHRDTSAQRLAEQRYAALFNHMTESVTVCRLLRDAAGTPLDYVVIDANRRCEEVFGRTLANSAGHRMTEIFNLPSAPRLAEFARVVTTGEPLRFEAYFATLDKYFSISAAPMGEDCFVAILFDINERKRAEDSLRVREARLARIFRVAPAGISVAIGRVIAEANDAFLDITGYSSEEMVGKPVQMLYVNEEECRRVGQSLYGSDVHDASRTVETRWRRKSGEVLDILLSCSPIEPGNPSAGVAVASLDVTEQRRLRAQLQQSQKLESLGRLAGGVAHDFNNLLTVINGYCDLTLAQLDASDLSRTPLGEIRRASERAAELTQQLLAFSRKQMIESKVIDLNTVVRDSEKMLSRIVGEDVHILIDLAPELGRVCAGPGQMHQVLMNLVVNARDAMPGGGTLQIETRNVRFTESNTAGHPEIVPGEHVLLAVTDSGIGMDEITRQRIFEPFFTTKEDGAGTGLGLATTYGIVRQSGGWISVDSEEAKGTAFKIYLPRVEPPPEIVEPRDARVSLRGTETVLVVEDHAEVCALATAILGGYGYSVLAAAGGADALRIATQHTGPIHLLLTDVVMPGMSGRELADRMTALRPSLRVLYMSGHTESTLASQGVLAPAIAYLPKPFSPEKLAGKIREVLAG